MVASFGAHGRVFGTHGRVLGFLGPVLGAPGRVLGAAGRVFGAASSGVDEAADSAHFHVLCLRSAAYYKFQAANYAPNSTSSWPCPPRKEGKLAVQEAGQMQPALKSQQKTT